MNKLQNFYRNAATLLIVLALPSLALAQLPELPLPSTATGAATTAKFFAGSTADDAASFANTFASDQAIDVLTEIQPEDTHIGTQGNTYLIIVLGEQFFMRVGESYLVWDGQIGSLQAVANKTLGASEPISIVEGISFGSLGLENVALTVFLAYDTEAAPGELYFSGSPLLLSIGGATPAPVQTSFDFFTANISEPIIQGNCLVCHVSGGAAGNTALLYVSSANPNAAEANHNALVSYINSSAARQSRILTAPQGIAHGGGIRLPASSSGFQLWAEYVALVVSEQE